MSKRSDIERAERGEVFRSGSLVHSVPGEKVDPRKGTKLILTCGICRQVFTEDMAPGHLQVCQPHGAICG